MISEIFSFLLSKPAIFFENLGVILKISETREKKKTDDLKISFMGWVTFSFMEIFYKSPPLRNFKKWRKGGFVAISPDVIRALYCRRWKSKTLFYVSVNYIMFF